MTAAALAPAPDAAAPAHLLDLFRELNDLKRIRSAGRRGSIASRRFRQAWSRLAAGEPAADVMAHVVATTLVAARLADLDRATLVDLGLAAAAVDDVLDRALHEVGGGLSPTLRERFARALRAPEPAERSAPAFVQALEDQPRAGITCPGRPRIVLEPPENHAEHCLMVATYGVLLSDAYGADPQTVFLAALAHHLHNAAMPDAGFTGEVLLGRHLDGAMAQATAAALSELLAPVRAEVEAARAILPDAATPEGRAFHAADVVDRVLQIAQHLRAASLGMDDVLGEMHLVHEGPVKPFHDRVLREMGLL